MLTRQSGIRLSAATAFALVFGAAAVSAQGNSGKPTTQPIGTMQIASMGGATSAIYGFSFGVANPLTSSGGGGAGSGKASLTAVEVSRMPDTASPLLFKDAVLGMHLPSVQFTMGGTGKSAQEATYVLKDALVSGFSTIDGVERVSFSYRSIEVFVAGMQFCFNVAENAEC